MEVIYQARQTGRTTKLIEMCAAAEERGELSYLVCSSHQQCYETARRAAQLDLSIGFPISYKELHDIRGKNIKNLFIDNADWLLQSLTPIRIAAISLERKEEDVVS